MDMEGFAADQSTTDASNSTEKLFHPDRAISEKHDTKANSTELDCNSSILSADSQYSMYMCAVKQEHYNPTALGPVLEAFFAPNLAASEERINVENSDYPERTQIVADFLQQSTLYTTEHSTHFSQNQSLSVQDEGDDKILDLGGTYQNTCKVLGRHDPYDTPTHSSLIAPQASSFIMSSCTRGAVEQINSEPVASDTAITEANRLFLTDELLSEDSQDYNLNDVFGGLKSTFPPVLTPVPRKSSEFLEEQCMQMTAGRITEGRSVPSGHVNRLLPKRPVLDQPSGIGWAGMRKDDDTNEVIERVFSRKYLVTEHSEEAYPRLPSSNTISNSDSGENDINSTHCEIEIDEDDFEQHKSMSQQPKGSLETDIQVLSNLLGMRTLGNEVETRFGSEVQNIENQKNNIGDPCAFVGDYNDFCEPGDEVLVKTMGWFPMEEYSNENNDTNLSVHWILNEAPSASDLPHLESLLEISPSKFWSPESESKKRPPAHFGYLFRSEQSQSPRSIEYILKKTPASSPEVSGRILGGAPGVHISSKEPNHQCSQSRPDTHGAAQKILTPCMNTMISWTWRDSIERSIKSPTFGSGRNHAQVQLCIPEVSPVFSEDNNKNKTSRERNVALPANQDQPKGYTSTITASNGCISERREKNLKVGITAQRGKNLVIDFLKVGTTIQEKIEPLRNDVQSKDNLVSPSSTLRPHVENTSSAKMRLQFSEGLYTEERENASSSLGLQNLQGDDGNRFTKSDSPPLRPLSSSVMFQGRFQDDKNCIRKRDTPLVPLSDISNHPNLAARLRNSLHEKLESQVQFPKPVAVSEFLGNESLITEKCPQRLAPGNIAWSSPTIPRVSRKRSGRGTMPKDSKVEVSNMFTNGKVYRQTVRSTPDEDYYTCKKRKRTSKSTFVELQTFPRNVNLRLLVTSPSSECETDLRKMTMPEGMNVKSPILTRLVKPLQLIQSAPAKGRARTRIRTTPKGMRNRLSTEYRNASPVHFIKNSPIKHNADIIKAALRSAKNLGVNGTRTQRHEVEEETLSKGSADCETSKTAALRSSKYRGVTRHRHTGRYEAHLWDNSKVKLGLAKRGRQVYLGAYPDENEAAQAHDLAALKYWGPGVYTNFPPSLYEQELKTMKTLTKEEYILLLRRKSPGFTRGISKYRGVTRHHQEGRWEARIGRHSGAKYHYLGTYDTQEEAAVAYDRAAVVHRGTKAITNFDISNYIQKNPKAF